MKSAPSFNYRFENCKRRDKNIDFDRTDQLIDLALTEDLGAGDITSAALFSATQTARAEVVAKESIVVCGQDVARRVFSKLDLGGSYKVIVQDGIEVSSPTVIAEVSGALISILSGERVALNFLQRLSGISTQTARLVTKVKPYAVSLLDTRKTTPGYRHLEKYAVQTGGGKNHRMGLFDAVMIKNNHIDLLGGDIGLAVTKCRRACIGKAIEVEVRNQKELGLALEAEPDLILLDNMSVDQVKAAIELIRSGIKKNIAIEVSGGINENNLESYAACRPDYISLGALTHSVRSVDLSLRIVS